MTSFKKRFGTVALSAVATIVAVIVAGLVSAPLPARGQVVLGTITGTVTDAQGAALPNAVISVKNQDTGVSQSTRTDARGVFTLRVAPGENYSVTAEKDRFEKVAVRKLSIPLGNPTTLDIKLEVDARQTVI